MIIKKKHIENCDISNLCIELVVKEMSQWDALSWRTALKKYSVSCWRCILLAIWTLWANSGRNTKPSNMRRCSGCFETVVDENKNKYYAVYSIAVLWTRRGPATRYLPHPHYKCSNVCQRRDFLSNKDWLPLLVPLNQFTLPCRLLSLKPPFRENWWWNWWKVPKPIVDKRCVLLCCFGDIERQAERHIGWSSCQNGCL